MYMEVWERFWLHHKYFHTFLFFYFFYKIEILSFFFSFFFFFLFLDRKLRTLFKKIKREHHVKELAQEILSFIFV